jgi:hypothetical protein
LSVQHAFLEGQKAWETCARKGTTRTLKEIRQQYLGVFGRNEMDPPLCGSTSMSHNEIKIREPM